MEPRPVFLAVHGMGQMRCGSDCNGADKRRYLVAPNLRSYAANYPAVAAPTDDSAAVQCVALLWVQGGCLDADPIRWSRAADVQKTYLTRSGESPIGCYSVRIQDVCALPEQIKLSTSMRRSVDEVRAGYGKVLKTKRNMVFHTSEVAMC